MLKTFFSSSLSPLVGRLRERATLQADGLPETIVRSLHACCAEREASLRIIVQVLFFEQLQLRTSIAGCFLVSDNLNGSRQLRSGFVELNEGGWARATRENQDLKVGMDNMKLRVSELEYECSNMKQEIEKLGRAKGSSASGTVSKKFGFNLKYMQCPGGMG
ncbi:hypothetical protein L6164_033391 [Bauhinia variegata]|uniref:Uncharacterized protein n=1 Tax=Bauhinia variegata TaxID=167791 RepID=A0ACB9KS30_BAUVA|nr:hypothetical protein L6164_033391 [Bauhinia variegata]